MDSAPHSERTPRSSNDPLRPSDHIDAEPTSADTVAQPALGFVGWARFLWRQLTSMRTAIALLLLLALAAIPGSLVPQRSSDPNGVIVYQLDHPDRYEILNALGVFNTFTSPWFSAIYILLFISLVGCIIPRIKHHAQALRSRPPKTPARLSRLVGYTEATATADVDTAVEAARGVLKKSGYRVERYGNSISAERGYMRETGNLIFHTSLVGVLVTVAIGGGLNYSGERVMIEGQPFTNTLAGYDTQNLGALFDESMLDPFAVRLDDFDGQYELDLRTGSYAPLDYTAFVSVRTHDTEWRDETIKVNWPLDIDGTRLFLMSNGFAPEITVRAPDGTVAYTGAMAFPQPDGNLASRGVFKVPDGLESQVGFMGFFYPDAAELTDGTFTSVSPYSGDNSLLTLNMYVGDLGLDEGVSVNQYTLNIDDLDLVAGPSADVKSLKMRIGETVELPNGLGTIEFTSLKRYIGVQIHHDVTQVWVLVFASLVLGGLLLSLFIPRRRVWVAVTASGDGDTVRLEYAGLARGEDPGLESAVSDIARTHASQLESRITP